MVVKKNLLFTKSRKKKNLAVILSVCLLLTLPVAKAAGTVNDDEHSSVGVDGKTVHYTGDVNNNVGNAVAKSTDGPSVPVEPGYISIYHSPQETSMRSCYNAPVSVILAANNTGASMLIWESSVGGGAWEVATTLLPTEPFIVSCSAIQQDIKYRYKFLKSADCYDYSSNEFVISVDTGVIGDPGFHFNNDTVRIVMQYGDRYTMPYIYAPAFYPTTGVTLSNNTPLGTTGVNQGFLLGSVDTGAYTIEWRVSDCGKTGSKTFDKVYVVSYPECGGSYRAVDADGNFYNTVRVGAECWTQENLHNLHYNSGDTIVNSRIYVSNQHNDTLANLATFGRLYDWYSAARVNDTYHIPLKNVFNHVEGVCPTGWILPTENQYSELNTNYESRDLRSVNLWLDGGGTNLSGMTMLPGGMYNSVSKRCENLLGEAYFWTDMELSLEKSLSFWVDCYCYQIERAVFDKKHGMSVRCVKEKTAYEPTVLTLPVTGINTTSCVLNGDVADAGALTILDRGFSYGTGEMPTVESGTTVHAATMGTGAYSVAVGGLTSDVLYYVRAFAVNAKGISYGEQQSFIPTLPLDTISFVGNGGLGFMTPQFVYRGVSTPLKSNGFIIPMCTFAGWSLAPNTAVVYANQAPIVSTGSMSLFAQWYRPTHRSYTRVACDSYTWAAPEGNGETYTTSGTYLYTHLDVHECTQVDTLHLTVNYGTHNVETQTACESYTWHGTTYTTTGTYTYPYTNTVGCPSVDTLKLTVNYGTHNVETQTACESYTWHGTTYTTTGTYTYPYTNTVGCPSVDTLKLTVNYGTHNVETQTACESYTWHGTTYTTTGTYTYPYTNTVGCPSVDTLKLTVNYGTHNVETQTACESYEWHGTTYTTTGTYTYPYTNTVGCPSVDTLKLTVNYGTHNVETQTACESYTWHGTTYTTTGTYTYPYTNTVGCPSVDTLKLTVNYGTHNVETQTACENYTWHGTTYTTTGTYTYPYTNTVGCPSVDTLKLTVNYGTHNVETKTACESYEWHGTTYTTTGTYTYPYTNTVGCPSVDTLKLTVNYGTHNVETQTACESYTWHGTTYTTTGTYTYPYTNTVGCPSVDTLKLTVNYGTHNVETQTACESYTWHSTTYTTTGTYTYPYTNTVGCPSVDTLKLTVNYGTHNVETQTACESYEWHGTTYTTTGTYTYPYTNTVGCPSVDTLKLTVNYGTHNVETQTACESYEWHGTTYTTTGTYTYPYTNTVGCPSVDTLKLTVNYGTHNVETQTACESYTWHGTTYTTTGTYTYPYTNTVGCPSVDTLKLTVNYGTHNVETQTACENYTWHGTTYTTTGTYTYSYTNTVGCPSVDTLKLTVNYGTHNVETKTACESYEWHGTTYTTTGTYTYPYTNTVGCPSVDTLKLTVNKSVTETVKDTICKNILPYTWRDTTFAVGTTTGDYVFYRHTVKGCDSTVTLKLVVKNCYDTITFMPNGATGGTMEKQVVTRGVATALNANGFNHNQNHHPEDTNWVFIGWNTSGYDSVAYAPGASITTNGNDTLYAQWHTWCIGNALTGEMGTDRVDSVKDYENNWYKVVQIGNQCWLKENMKTTHYANGEIIPGPCDDFEALDAAYWFYPGFESNPTKKDFYGLLYNWTAIMDSAASSSAYPSGVQGICPTGWHVPSKAEIDTMYIYVQRQPQYVTQDCSDMISCDNEYCYFCIAKSLATTVSWDSVSYRIDDYCVGDATYYNNRTGFSYVPNMDMRTDCWTFSSQISDYGSSVIFTGVSSEKSYAFSEITDVNQFAGARCVRDVIITDTITFMPNGATGGAMEKQVVPRGVATALNANAFNHNVPDSNWAFIGWNTDALGNGTSYAAGANITTNGNDTLYAQWHTWCNGTAITGEMGSTDRVDSVRDYDNNWYKVVQIGNQCWLKENLKTTHYANGDYIKKGIYPNYLTDFRYFPNGDTNNVAKYGHLYNSLAAMNITPSTELNPNDVQGVCPNGWHLPSDSECTQLTDFVGSQNQYVCGIINSKIAKAMATTTGWDRDTNIYCNVGFFPSTNNTTGFSAVPAGRFTGEYYHFGKDAYIWTTSIHLLTFHLSSELPVFQYSPFFQEYAASVRCVRNLPVMDTITFMPNGATGGTMEKQVVTRGVITALNANGFNHDAPDANWAFIGWNTDALGNGTSYAAGANITTNGNDTLYAQWHTWCNGTAITGEMGSTDRVDSVRDYDNNWYKVVQIGNQCWLKENLRTTRYANGDSIQLGSSSSDTQSLRYYPDNSASNVATYGYLYNWTAVMDSTASSDSNPSGVQGVCPNGWHVPSDAELTLLTDYVSSKSAYQCSSNNNIAKALASISGWSSDGGTCTIGNTPTSNNTTGFSTLPAGSYFYESCLGFGLGAYYWSTTTYFSSGALVWMLGSSAADVNKFNAITTNGSSVRCVRDVVSTIPKLGLCETCSEGSITVKVSENIASIVWRNSDNDSVSNNLTGLTQSASIPAGVYTATATSSDGHTVTRTATLGKATARPCTVASLNAGTSLAGGKYANKEFGSGTRLDSVSDHQGNVYRVTQIGEGANAQCWLAENMRCTTSPSTGSTIVLGNMSSYIASHHSKYAINHDSTRYGVLYNWCAAVDTFDAAGGKPEVANATESTGWNFALPAGNRRGICPEGWHVPTNDEWTSMVSLAGVGQVSSDTGVSKLSGGCDWPLKNSGSYPGSYADPERNSTGFSALPAGNKGGMRTFVGIMSFFWSATSNVEQAYARIINKDKQYLDTQAGTARYSTLSVRCVRNN